MTKKKAVIIVELVDESEFESDEKIIRELLEWFTDSSNLIPWVKNAKSIVLKD